MKHVKKLSALLLILSLALSLVIIAPLYAGAAAPTAVCTVTAAGYNVGTADYYIGADVTFSSEDSFTAGLFTVEAKGLTLTDCTVASCSGGEAPEINADYDKSKILFTGFGDSDIDDFRSYTSLTLTLKFTVDGDAQPGDEKSILIKNINIANVDEQKFVTADTQLTLDEQHIHSVGEEWAKDETYHWKVCTECENVVNRAEHTFDSAVTEPTCTKGGYTTYTCSVCGYSYVGDETEATEHTVGEWLSNEQSHWHVCTGCSVIVDSAAHTESDWITDTPATTEAAGHRHKECVVCGYRTAEEDIEKLSGDRVPGDINGDGSVNNKDLTRLFQYLSDWDVEVDEGALDVNGDGSVNNKDLTRLFQYLSDWDVEIFYGAKDDTGGGTSGTGGSIYLPEVP